MDLIKLIKAKRPNLKDNSLRSYLTTLRILNDNKEIENLNFIKKTDVIMDKINDMLISSLYGDSIIKKNRYYKNISVILDDKLRKTINYTIKEYITGIEIC